MKDLDSKYVQAFFERVAGVNRICGRGASVVGAPKQSPARLRRKLSAI